MKLSLTGVNRQDRGGNFRRSLNRSRARRLRNSPNHRGIHLPRQGEILVRVPRAERVQSGTSRVAVLPILVYREVPCRAGPCEVQEAP